MLYPATFACVQNITCGTYALFMLVSAWVGGWVGGCVGGCVGWWVGVWVSDNDPGSNQYCVLFSKVDFSHIFTYGKLLNFNLDLNF